MAGDLDDGPTAEIDALLGGSPALVAAARAGLDEIQRQHDVAHRLLAITLPPEHLAAADDEAPLPYDRQTMVDGETFEAVYYRIGLRGHVAIVGKQSLTAVEGLLDGRALAARRHDDRSWELELGPLRQACGRCLRLVVQTTSNRHVASITLYRTP